MLLVEAIGRGSVAAEASALGVPSEWLAAILARAEMERGSYWIEILDYRDHAQAPVVICRGDRLGKVLRGTVSRPPSEQGKLVLLRLDRDAFEARLRSFAADFGLVPSAVRTLIALVRCCNVRHAAAQAGISYETAREYLVTARLALGAENLAHLVTLAVVAAGVGDLDRDSEEADLLMCQPFGLTARQAYIAGLTANGFPRKEVARRTDLSETLVKKELAVIFAATGVAGAIGLAHLMAELRLLAMHMDLTPGLGLAPEAAYDQLLFPAGGNRTVAVNDYGPESGRPVFVLHSSTTTRPANRALVRALQKRGFRPLSIDRPGFGDTADAPADLRTDAYFDLAAQDMLAVGAAMGLTHFPIVSRGAAQVVLALQRIAPEAIAAAVVMNPDPDAPSSSRHDNFLARLKRHFVRRPWAVRAMAHWLARLLTLERVRDHLHRAAIGCTADQQVLAEEANVQEYHRSLSSFRAGRLDGFVREQVAIATMEKPAPTRGTVHFRFLVGEHDTLHEPAETLAYWRELLPDGMVCMVPGAGRFMSYSHPEIAARALTEALGEDRPDPT